MKKFSILIVGLIVLSSSCQRSQFSTTTRHYKNGRVTYVNNYHKERSRKSKGTYHKNHFKEPDLQNIKSAVERTEMQNHPGPGITSGNNVLITNPSDLLASTSNNPIIYKTDINLINSDNYKKDPIGDHFRWIINDSIADTNKNKKPDKDLTFARSFAHIIKFKNGNEDTVRIISHSHEGIYYHRITEPKKTRFVMMAEVDTILTDTTHSFKQEQDITTKQGQDIGPNEQDITPREAKSQDRWLTYSVMGIIPLIGIPFAIIGIIMGARNLYRIRNNQASIKGKKIARSTLITGIITLIWNIFITIVIFSALAASASSAMSRCSGGPHF
jgi:hypothetical protein